MKEKEIPTSLVPRNLNDISLPTGNVYESIVIVGKRTKQINARVREELNAKLEDFTVPADTGVEIYENHEQIALSCCYERLPKATTVAIDEFLGRSYFIVVRTPRSLLLRYMISHVGYWWHIDITGSAHFVRGLREYCGIQGATFGAFVEKGRCGCTRDNDSFGASVCHSGDVVLLV